jgi:hypothetical protein
VGQEPGFDSDWAIVESSDNTDKVVELEIRIGFLCRIDATVDVFKPVGVQNN